MANTIVYGNETIGITPDGATDYDVCTDTNLGSPANGIYVEAIIFKPSAVNDVIAIRDKVAGPALLYQTDVTGGGLVVYPCRTVKLYLDASDCTFGTAANVRITIIYKASPTGV